MKQKKLFIVVVIVASAILIGVFIFIKNRPQITTATSYEDAAGWVYSCSQPIKVRDQGVKYMSGKPSLTPIDQSEAAKYCHKFGIE